MKLTNKQLTQLKEVANNETIDLLKQWYPEKFEVEKKVHTFYYEKDEHGEYLFAFYSTNTNDVYGFFKGKWTDTSWIWPLEEYPATLATEEQILKFMIPEAKKRGYKNGNYKCMYMRNYTAEVEENSFLFEDWQLWQGAHDNANLIFEKGKWAEIIQTITKEEAEKMLNAKII
jgi:hypothetical protein